MDAVSNFMDTMKANTVECAYWQEMVGTAVFMLLGCVVGDNDGFRIGAVYAMMYTLCKWQFPKCRANFNPALTMADFMNDHLTIGPMILMWISQGVGGFIGYMIGGLLVPAQMADFATGDFDFFASVCTEFIGTALMVWIWLDIHSSKRSATWAESFYGFAPGLMYFVAMAIMSGSANCNPAKYEAKWAAADVVVDGVADWGKFISKDFWSAGFEQHNMTFYFAPIVSAFMTCLVYSWVNK